MTINLLSSDSDSDSESEEEEEEEEEEDSKVENTVSLDPARKADWARRLEELRSKIQEIIDHRHEDIQLPECLAAEDERYKFVIPIELFYDNVRKKWPNGNNQRIAAFKRNAELRALATASKTTALGKRKVGE